MRGKGLGRGISAALAGAALLAGCALGAPAAPRRASRTPPEQALRPRHAGALTAEQVRAAVAVDVGELGPPPLGGTGGPGSQDPPSPSPEAGGPPARDASPQAAEARPPDVVLPGRVRVPILVYHHVVADAELPEHRGNPMVISDSALHEQFAWLSARGFQALTPEQLLAHYESNAPLPENPVWITFDDGYDSVYTHVLPALRRFGLRATAFVVTGWVGRPRYLNWNQVAELARSGLVDFESHSHDLHRRSGRGPVALELPQEAVFSDLMESRRRIARHTGREPVAIAYPFGAHSKDVLAAARRAGFRLGVRADEQRHPAPGDPLLLLTRHGVFQWKRMPTFERMLRP